jgi:CBS domain-containing protein
MDEFAMSETSGKGKGSEHAAAWLGLRERRTLGPGGDVDIETFADCPRSETSTEVAECRTCGDGQLFHVDGAGRRARLYCSHVAPASRAPRPYTIDANTPVRAMVPARCTCVREGVSLEAIATLFLEEGVTAVPVVDAEGRPIGMISKTDILRDVRDRSSLAETPLPQRLRHAFHVDPVAGVCATDVMSPLVFAIVEDATIGQALPLMTFEHIHHAPVVGTHGRVVGVLSSMDVLRFLASILVAPE